MNISFNERELKETITILRLTTMIHQDLSEVLSYIEIHHDLSIKLILVDSFEIDKNIFIDFYFIGNT